MSEANTQEPTMEEILASIRRIISEDDAPAATPASDPVAEAAPEPVAAAPEPLPPPAFDEGDDDDVLELTDPVSPPAAAALARPEEEIDQPGETLGDIDVFPRAPSRPAAVRAPEPAPKYDEDEEGLISPPNADIAASAFNQLSRRIAMPAPDRTLEDVVSELLRPLLKDWLDRHLPEIVETAVQAEVDRISRRRSF